MRCPVVASQHRTLAPACTARCTAAASLSLHPRCWHRHRKQHRQLDECHRQCSSQAGDNIQATSSSSSSNTVDQSSSNIVGTTVSPASTPSLESLLPPSTMTDALRVAFMASSGSSLLAAQCLVETVLEQYLQGTSFSAIQMDLALSLAAATESVDQDTLSAWVALVMLTLEELQVQRPPPSPCSQRPSGLDTNVVASSNTNMVADGASPDQARFLQGMREFVRQTLGLHYASGYTVQRLTGLQRLVAGEAGAQPGGAQAVMQQYSRLVLLTVEVVEAMRLPHTPPRPQTQGRAAPAAASAAGSTPSPSRSSSSSTSAPASTSTPDSDGASPAGDDDANEAVTPEPSVAAPSGYTFAFQQQPQGCALAQALSQAAEVHASGPRAAGDAGAEAASAVAAARRAPVPPVPHPERALAVRLLVSLMAAVQGSRSALQRFAQTAALAYGRGLTAPQLLQQLQDSDFYNSGALVPVSQPASADPQALTSVTTTAATTAASNRQRRLFAMADDGGEEGQLPTPQPPSELLLKDINRQLFSVWLSICYFALAQMGVTHPAAATQLGWGWAGGAGDAVEAVGLERFVAAALRNSKRRVGLQMAGGGGGGAGAGLQDDGEQDWQDAGCDEQGAGSADGEAGDASGGEVGAGGRAAGASATGGGGVGNHGDVEEEDGLLARWVEQRPEVQELSEAERETAAAAYLRDGTLRGRPAPLLVKVEDDSLVKGSAALQLFAKQAALVEELYALVYSLEANNS